MENSKIKGNKINIHENKPINEEDRKKKSKIENKINK